MGSKDEITSIEKPLPVKELGRSILPSERKRLEAIKRNLLRSLAREERARRKGIALVRAGQGSLIVRDKRTGRNMLVKDILKRKIKEEQRKQLILRDEMRLMKNDIKEIQDMIKQDKRAKLKARLKRMGII